jgi:arylsulfatase
MYVDGQKAGEGRVDQTEPLIFSSDETWDVGFEGGSPVTYDYPARGTKFSGEVSWVEIDLGKDAVDLDHLITPEERFRVAMAKQ